LISPRTLLSTYAEQKLYDNLISFSQNLKW
jgi:hypothetical protein